MNTITAQNRIPCGQYIIMEHRHCLKDRNREKKFKHPQRGREECVLLFKELIGCFLSHGEMQPNARTMGIDNNRKKSAKEKTIFSIVILSTTCGCLLGCCYVVARMFWVVGRCELSYNLDGQIFHYFTILDYTRYFTVHFIVFLIK